MLSMLRDSRSDSVRIRLLACRVAPLNTSRHSRVTAPVALDDRVHPWQSYVITLDHGVDRGRVAAHLKANGVQCNFGTYASHVQPVYGFEGSLPVSADLFQRHLAIPMHANLSIDDVDVVTAHLRDAVAGAR